MATGLGMGAAWFTLFMVLTVQVIWSGYAHTDVVPTRVLTWLIWISFAVLYGVKGWPGWCSTGGSMPRKQEPGLKNCLREFRTASAGMTQQELADRVWVTGQTIVAMEGQLYAVAYACLTNCPGV